MENDTIPYELLNRKGRREHAKRMRNKEYKDRVWKFRKHLFNMQERSARALEARLDRVRAATKKRNGRCNNPRFRN